MHAVEDYEAHTQIITQVIGCMHSVRETELMGLGSELFSITQRIKNGGQGNPDTYRLLGELAARDDRLSQLYQHAYNPSQ